LLAHLLQLELHAAPYARRLVAITGS
jgi:hypothetical protein